jgi:hypothetical protein
MMARTNVRTRDVTRGPDLGITLDILNFEAQAIRRTRFAGTASAAYELQHDHINAVLDAWCDAADARGSAALSLTAGLR